jgi:hypothetical protein
MRERNKQKPGAGKRNATHAWRLTRLRERETAIAPS